MSVEPIVSAELVRSADEWAQTIRADLGRAVEGIVAAGRHLIAAKADVAHGEWLPMLREIGISARQAQELMSVGRNEAIANTSNCAHLPTAARALYELSRLDADEIEQHIETGTITPNMTIADARGLANPAPRREVVITDPETGEEIGRVVDDRDPDDYDPADDHDHDNEYSLVECTGCEHDYHPNVITEIDTMTLLCPDCLDDQDNPPMVDVALPEPNPLEEIAKAGPTIHQGKRDYKQTVDAGKPRRRPLEEGFFDATMRLTKAVTSLENLGKDDRLPRNKGQVTRYRNDLLQAIDALQRVANQLA